MNILRLSFVVLLFICALVSPAVSETAAYFRLTSDSYSDQSIVGLSTGYEINKERKNDWTAAYADFKRLRGAGESQFILVRLQDVKLRDPYHFMASDVPKKCSGIDQFGHHWVLTLVPGPGQGRGPE